VVGVHRDNCSEEKHNLCDDVESCYQRTWGEEDEPCRVAHDKQPGKEDGLALTLYTDVEWDIFIAQDEQNECSGWIG